jgi:hypothetical protein
MEKQKSSTFSTDNFQLAAYLLAESCSLIMADKTNPKRVLFVFEESDKRKELTQKFISYQALVEPHRYFSAQKDLKQMIYQK